MGVLLSPTDTAHKGGKTSLLQQSLLGIQTPCKGRYVCSSVDGQHKTNLVIISEVFFSFENFIKLCLGKRKKGRE